MLRRTRGAIIIFCIFSFLFAGCAGKHTAKTETVVPDRTPAQWGELSRTTVLSAMNETSDAKAELLASSAMEAGDRCLALDPDMPACLYWRAIAAGVYTEHHVIGYQERVKAMIRDCTAVIAKDPSYDHGGAYRVLAELYLRLPATGVHPASVVRDMARAEDYARKAVEIDPGYPENTLILAAVLYEKDELPEARRLTTNARTLIPGWEDAFLRPQWNKMVSDIEKKLLKRSGK